MKSDFLEYSRNHPDKANKLLVIIFCACYRNYLEGKLQDGNSRQQNVRRSMGTVRQPGGVEH